MQDDNIKCITVGKVKQRRNWKLLCRKAARFLGDAAWMIFDAVGPVIYAMMLMEAGVLFGAGFYIGMIMMSLCRL